MQPALVTTGTDISGYTITSQVGIVRGIVVRSRSVIGKMMASFQTFFEIGRAHV